MTPAQLRRPVPFFVWSGWRVPQVSLLRPGKTGRFQAAPIVAQLGWTSQDQAVAVAISGCGTVSRTLLNSSFTTSAAE